MAKPRTARIKLTPGGIDSEVEIDGHRLTGITGVIIGAHVNEMPAMSLDLLVHEIEVDGEMVVTVPDKTRSSLIALGWTPPDNDT